MVDNRISERLALITGASGGYDKPFSQTPFVNLHITKLTKIKIQHRRRLRTRPRRPGLPSSINVLDKPHRHRRARPVFKINRHQQANLNPQSQPRIRGGNRELASGDQGTASDTCGYFDL
jgi:hypothetical protein